MSKPGAVIVINPSGGGPSPTVLTVVHLNRDPQGHSKGNNCRKYCKTDLEEKQFVLVGLRKLVNDLKETLIGFLIISNLGLEAQHMETLLKPAYPQVQIVPCRTLRKHSEAEEGLYEALVTDCVQEGSVLIKNF